MKRGDNDETWDGEPEGRSYLTTAMPRPLVVRGGRALAPTRANFDEQQGGNPEINLLAYWHVLVKHRLVIAGAVGVMLILGLIFTLLTTPIYRATTMIQIDRESANVVGTGIESVTPDDSRNLEFYQTMYGQLKSRSLALRVVQKANLASNPDFMSHRRPSRTRSTSCSAATSRRRPTWRPRWRPVNARPPRC